MRKLPFMLVEDQRGQLHGALMAIAILILAAAAAAVCLLISGGDKPQG